MGWSRQAENDMLERIVAMLVALAGLAERAACLPALVRLPLLAVLGRGEAVARGFVMAIAHEYGSPLRPRAASPASGDAGRLAAGFRRLALTLAAILAGAWRRLGLPTRAAGAQPGSTMPEGRPAAAGRCRPLPPPDTS